MSKRHHCFQIQTPAGVQAKIHGDVNMRPETRRALAELIDAAAKIHEPCDICGAMTLKTHDPDCPNNPVYSIGETMTLEEFKSL